MHRDTAIEFGSVSTGTLRNEDLLPAFADVLADLGDDSASRVLAEIEAIETADNWNGETACWLLEEIIEVLQDYAPEFAYFGAIDGDGADFGFWPDFNHMEVAIADGDAIAVNDSAEIPADYAGPVFIQTDHGNVTYGFAPAYGRDFVAVWAIV